MSTDTAAFLTRAIDSLQDGIAIFDVDYALVLANQPFHQIFDGATSHLIAGGAWRLFMDEAKRKGRGAGFDQLNFQLIGGLIEPFSQDVTHGSSQRVRLSARALSEGGFILTASDVTEAYEADALRIETEALLRNVLDACTANILMSSVDDGRVIYQTPYSTGQFGVLENVRHLYADVEKRSELLAELLPTGAVDDFECDLLDKDGNRVPVISHARLIEYEHEKVILASAYDLTQLHAQRDELIRIRDIAHQNEKLSAMGGLLAGVAHELNNPLSVVVGHALMLQEDITDPTLKVPLDKISHSAERCARIVKTFLAIARQKPMTLVPSSMNEIVLTALDVCGHSLRQAGVTLEINLAEALPEMQVDEDQIAQILINILTNAEHALKDAPNAEVHISTRIDPATGMIAASFSDNGPGVPKEIRGRIFEPFFTSKPVGEGTGLGLSISHRIALAHGGNLELSESPSGGACFKVSLPRGAAPHTAMAPDQPKRAAQKETHMSVLLVEDEQDVADMISRILRNKNMAVTHCDSGNDALATLTRGQQFDVIVSDLKMQGMSGIDMMLEIDAQWPIYRDRSCFVTGDSMGNALSQYKSLSNRPILEKPFSPTELIELVTSLGERA
ncbi:MAG: ATP-binding protein [Hyphomonadaceae bacterium]|nr:ATP-binding protein [Hyphomonadaceae bacterium]